MGFLLFGGPIGHVELMWNTFCGPPRPGRGVGVGEACRAAYLFVKVALGQSLAHLPAAMSEQT